VTLYRLRRHGTKNSKQIFPEIKLCGLVQNFHINVSMSDLYIPTIGPPIGEDRSWEWINRSQIHESGNWEPDLLCIVSMAPRIVQIWPESTFSYH
jgi:hypothetical protein